MEIEKLPSERVLEFWARNGIIISIGIVMVGVIAAVLTPYFTEPAHSNYYRNVHEFIQKHPTFDVSEFTQDKKITKYEYDIISMRMEQVKKQEQLDAIINTRP